jgi:hypothetical protein
VIHLISECNEGKAEHQFWQMIQKYLNIELNIVCCSGIKNVDSILEDMYNDTDLFYLAVDNVDNKEVRDLYLNYQQNNNIVFSDYICFEEIFISYKNLKSYVRLLDEKQKQLYRVQELFYINVDEAIKIAGTIPNMNCTNIEHFISCVVSQITEGNKAIKISKGVYGDCWKSSCSDYQQKGHIYDCKNCNRENDNLTFIHKYNELYKESVLHNEILKLIKMSNIVNTNNDADLSLSKVVKMPSHGKVNLF